MNGKTTGLLIIPFGIAVVILPLLSYWPGLSGPFLFDDFANLPALAEFGGIHDFESLRLYLLNGIAGPTGRPLALLSFLIDDNGWPSDPWRFKYTNLMLHLLAGCLLAWLVFRIVLLRGRDEKTSGGIAISTAAFWLLHPLNVSTTLYVVQRMAIQSALFVLLGLLLYLYGRQQLPRLRAYLWMSLGVGLCTMLAVFSKENGAVLPILALVLEYFILRSSREQFPSRFWQAAFLWLPTAVLLAFIIWEGVTGRGYGNRAFTVGERLLTESRVLFDYLFHWFLPFLPPRGLFVEDFPISHGLFDPPATVFALMGLLLAAGWTLRNRQRYPFLALAFWFFLAGHLIESTTLGLEIYFEHRNYLPAMLLFLPVSECVVDRARQIRLLPTLLIVLLIGIAVTTHRLARIWSDEVRLAVYWSEQSPLSGRAQSVAASALEKHGYPQIAQAILARAVERQPADLHLRLHYLVQTCFSGELSQEEFRAGLEEFRRVPFDFKSYPFFESLLNTLPNSRCKSIGLTELQALLDALEQNPGARDSGAQRQLHHLKGMLYARRGLGVTALAEFNESLRLRPDISAGLLEVSILANQGFYSEALQLLTLVRALPIPGGNLYKGLATLDYPREMERLQRMLEDDLHHTKASGTSYH